VTHAPRRVKNFTECFEENLLPNGAFSTKLGPQVSLFPVPIFGFNTGSFFSFLFLSVSHPLYLLCAPQATAADAPSDVIPLDQSVSSSSFSRPAPARARVIRPEHKRAPTAAAGWERPKDDPFELHRPEIGDGPPRAPLTAAPTSFRDLKIEVRAALSSSYNLISKRQRPSQSRVGG
jgi:hypothetical protein